MKRSDLIGKYHKQSIGSSKEMTIGSGIEVNFHSSKPFVKKSTPFEKMKITEKVYPTTERDTLYYQIVYTKDDFEKLKEKIFKGGLGFFSHALNVKLTQMHSYSQSDTKIAIFLFLAHASGSISKLEFKDSIGSKKELMAKFNRAATQELTEKNVIKESFIKKFGTHYVSVIQHGAVLLGRVTILANTKEEIKTFRVALGAQYGTSIASAKLGTAIQKSKSSKLNSFSASFNYNLEGGPVLSLPIFHKFEDVEENINKIIADFYEQIDDIKKTKRRNFNFVINTKYQPWKKVGLKYPRIKYDRNTIKDKFNEALKDSVPNIKLAIECLSYLSLRSAKDVVNRLITIDRNEQNVDGARKIKNESNIIMRLAYIYYQLQIKRDKHEKNLKLHDLEQLFGKEISDIVQYSNDMAYTFQIKNVKNEDDQLTERIVGIENELAKFSNKLNEAYKLRAIIPSEFPEQSSLAAAKLFSINFVDDGKKIELINPRFERGGVLGPRYVFKCVEERATMSHTVNNQNRPIQVRAVEPNKVNQNSQALFKLFTLHPYRYKDEETTSFCIYYGSSNRLFVDNFPKGKNSNKTGKHKLKMRNPEDKDCEVPDYASFTITRV